MHLCLELFYNYYNQNFLLLQLFHFHMYIQNLEFDKRIKYVMPKESSIDIDDIYDFMLIERIMKTK